MESNKEYEINRHAQDLKCFNYSEAANKIESKYKHPRKELFLSFSPTDSVFIHDAKR